jgi:hypothetical protein
MFAPWFDRLIIAAHRDCCFDIDPGNLQKIPAAAL